MERAKLIALAATAALGAAGTAAAQTQGDLSTLREQVRQLEKRVQDAEATAQQAAVQASSRPTGENALNPAVSVILNGVYSNLSQDPNGFRINGFVPTMGEVGPGVRGLSLGESELALASNIDHNFRGTLIASISPDNNSIGVEEGYIQTLSLSNGFTIKAGRFFSGVGYQNQIHAHAWDFTDAPLANKVFLGNQLNEDGVQLKWVAPTETYFDVGMEVGRGRQFPAGPAGGRNKNGVGSSNLFAHVGGDLGTSIAWQTGVSYLSTSPQDRTFDNLDSNGNRVNTNSFTGNSRLWVLDGILKWAPNQNPTYTNFKLQGEYFRRKEDGDLTFNTTVTPQTGGFASVQSGWYLQGVYQFVPMWRVGYRYDRLNSGTTSFSSPLSAADFPILAAYNPTRHTVMVDWSPSEFSRIRLQAASDKSRSDATDHQVFLQYIVSLGAHGAHKF
ncbi:MAG TPA: hypothetical protein VK143_03595 [Burkholderiales bacterium]|nr:hypothetical protein [Burkholderiales bacterium]